MEATHHACFKTKDGLQDLHGLIIPHAAWCIVGLLIPTVLEVAPCVDSPILLSCGYLEEA